MKAILRAKVCFVQTKAENLKIFKIQFHMTKEANSHI